MYLMYTKILTALFFTLSKAFSKVYGKPRIMAHLEQKCEKLKIYSKIFSFLFLLLLTSFSEI